MWCDVDELTIPLLLWQRRMCFVFFFWQDWWPHNYNSPRPRDSWLIDTSLWRAGLITVQNAQKAAVCSHVRTLSPLCLSDNPGSILHQSFVLLFLSVDLLLHGVKTQTHSAIRGHISHNLFCSSHTHKYTVIFSNIHIYLMHTLCALVHIQWCIHLIL